MQVHNSQNLSILTKSVLSFSLGLSQLDVKEQTNPIFRFVHGKFDNEDSNFTENRLKHRNDPAKMKKLKKVARTNSKKPTAKSSSKKKSEG